MEQIYRNYCWYQGICARDFRTARSVELIPGRFILIGPGLAQSKNFYWMRFLESILIDRKAKLITVGSICHLFIETKIAANEVILVKYTKSLKLLLIIFANKWPIRTQSNWQVEIQPWKELWWILGERVAFGKITHDFFTKWYLDKPGFS